MNSSEPTEDLNCARVSLSVFDLVPPESVLPNRTYLQYEIANATKFNHDPQSLFGLSSF